MSEAIELCQNLQRRVISTAIWLLAKALAAEATKPVRVKKLAGVKPPRQLKSLGSEHRDSLCNT